MSKGADGPNPIDIHVGQRLRARRKSLGISQSHLADDLGLTFQQVQKYERGTNRVSASVLFMISQILKAPVSYFFDGLGPSDGKGDYADIAPMPVVRLLTEERDGPALAEAFLTLKGPVRQAVVIMVVALASKERAPSDADGGSPTPRRDSK